MCAKYYINSRLNSQHSCGGGGYMINRIVRESIHFDNEQDIHVRSINHEKSGYNLNLDLLTIMY